MVPSAETGPDSDVVLPISSSVAVTPGSDWALAVSGSTSSPAAVAATACRKARRWAGSAGTSVGTPDATCGCDGSWFMVHVSSLGFAVFGG